MTYKEKLLKALHLEMLLEENGLPFGARIAQKFRLARIVGIWRLKMSIVNYLHNLFGSEIFTALYEKLKQDGELQKVYEENYKGNIYQVEVYEYEDMNYTIKLKNNVVQVIYIRG